jgi:hypothetical protein
MRRIAALKNQPNTVRGNCIKRYSSLENKPLVRVAIFLGITLFVLAHTLTFCILALEKATEPVSSSHITLWIET